MRFDKEACFKYSSIVGAHLITAPLSFIWIYGNLSAYVDSYFRFACYPGCADGDPQWVLAFYMAGICPGFFMFEPMMKRIGLKWTGLLAMVTCNAAIIGSAWTLQVSVTGTAILLGFVMGPSLGITLSTAFRFIKDVAPESAAILTASTTSFSTMLSVVENQAITEFVNPRNIKPNAIVGPKNFFSTPEVLDRVPGAIIIIGCISLACQLVGYSMMAKAPKSSEELNAIANGDAVGKTTPSNAQDKVPSNGAAAPVNNSDKQDLINNTPNGKDYGSNASQSSGGTCDSPPADHDQSSDNVPADHSAVSVSEDAKPYATVVEKIPRSFTPMETIRKPLFWTVWFAGLSLFYGLTLKSNYYKQFGLVYIPDDKFLTLVGTLYPIVSSVARVVCGILIDHDVITIKGVFVFGLATHAILCVWQFHSAQVDGVLYMFLIFGQAISHSLFYVLTPTATLRIFGPAHFSTNYALVFLTVGVCGVISAIIVTPLLEALGWFWLFTTCGIGSIVIMAFVVVANFELN